MDDLVTLLRRFIILPPFGYETLVLWIVHTYAFELRDVSTYIGIESPVKRCGKTTLLGDNSAKGYATPSTLKFPRNGELK